MTTEKRLYKRYAFPKDSDITATLIPVEGDGKIEARILNVSQGGIGLAADKKMNGKLSEEAELFVENITGKDKLPCLNGQLIRIKWVINYEPLNNFGVGCEFVNLRDECLDELKALFLEGDLAERGS